MKREHAIKLLNLIANNVSLVAVMKADAVIALAELRSYAEPGKVGVYVQFDRVQKVRTVKTIRKLTGWGLKNAVDFMKAHEHSTTGWMGPVLIINDNDITHTKDMLNNDDACIKFEALKDFILPGE